MSASDLPSALESVERILEPWTNRPASARAIRSALDALSPGAPTNEQPPLQELVSTSPLTWLALGEAANDGERAVLVAKLLGTFTRFHSSGVSPLVINVGGSGQGRVGLAIGLATTADVARRWAEGLATEMVFAPGEPYGWSELGARPYERAVLGITSVAARERQQSEVLPTFLELVLGAGTAMGPWSIDLVLRPLPAESSEVFRQRSLAVLLRAQQSVSATSAQTEVLTSSYTDAAAEQLVEVLKQWQTLAQDCLRVGGWTVAVRARAAAEPDLSAVTAIFTAALGDDVHGSHAVRRQSWLPSSLRAHAEESPTWLSSRET